MITAVYTNTAYLIKLPGRSGFYFQRKVPSDLIQSFGKKLWRWKAGDTLQEARRAAVESLAKTDQLIATHRGSVTPELLQSLAITPDLQGDPQAQGLTPQDIWPRHSPEDAHKLVLVQSGQALRTSDEL